MIDRARRAWPDVRLEEEAFRAYVEARALDAGDLEDDALGELYLACACGQGDETALRSFEARYLDVVPAALAHMKLSPEQVDEVRQLVRQKLLVAEPGRAPKLDDYVGQGKLRGLVQVVAVRTALSLLRKNKPGRDDPDALADLPDGGHDPELSYMKEKYRGAFKRAFATAIGALSSRERNFLRLHHFGGLTVEQAGDVYGVHRATATRWLAKIRGQISSDTKKHLGAELDVSSAELESLVALVQSRLDVSLQRLLDTPSPEPDAADGEPPSSDRPG